MLRALLLIAALIAGPVLALGEDRVIRDWTTTCDDDLLCMATTAGEGSGGYQMRFTRASDDSSAWALRFFLKDVPQPKTDGEMSISVDGGEPVSFYEEYGFLRDVDGVTFGLAGGADLDKLFAALRKGRKLALSYETPDGKTQKQSFSLSGLAAVLLWIDEQQSRVGRSTEISSPAGVEGEAEFKATKEIADKIEARVKFDCEPPVPNRPDIESYRLPGGFALHVAPCFAGAYNFTQLYFLERRGELQLLYFADYGDAWTGTNQLFNSEYDPKTGWLSASYKGRGVGGCGSTGQWIWSGYSFRLVEFTVWPDCDQPSDEWTVVYEHKAK